MERILVVGLGAVGQVYGHHLAAGGAAVSAWVKPARRREAEAGYRLTQIAIFGRRTPRSFTPEAVYCAKEELVGARFDQVWVCIPTTALTDELLKTLGGACPDATFVILSPGHFVREQVLRFLEPSRVVFGVIGMVSYQAPLAGSTDPRELATEPSTAYFLNRTKLSASQPASGQSERRLLDAEHALSRGGAPTDRVRDAWVELSLGSALLMPNIATIESVGWSLRRYGRDAAEQAASATRESLDIMSAVVGQPPAPTALLRPWMLGLAAKIGARFAPFDLERFFEWHFTKVSAQTRLLLKETAREGARLGLPHDAIDALIERLDVGTERAESPKDRTP